jgi:hypothetical protein
MGRCGLISKVEAEMLVVKDGRDLPSRSHPRGQYRNSAAAQGNTGKDLT